MTATNIADSHTERVCRSFDRTPDPRTKEILTAAVRYLHGFVEEVGLTRAEWLAAIEFLTAVGHACDELRQEFILLSDTLGLSMLVEMINERKAAGATDPTVLGPFHVPDAPPRSFGDSIVDDASIGGDPLVLHGTVRRLDGRPVGGATVEVWEVQPNGRYDIEEDPEKRNLRGAFQTGDDGRYELRTVRPVDYTIPDDGPVGAMLRATRRGSWRPAHIHLLVRAAGFRTLVTHAFDGDSRRLSDDAVFAVGDSLIAPMSDGDCEFDLVIEKDESEG